MNILLGSMSMFAGFAAFCTSVLHANPFIAFIAIGLMFVGGWLVAKNV